MSGIGKKEMGMGLSFAHKDFYYMLALALKRKNMKFMKNLLQTAIIVNRWQLR